MSHLLKAMYRHTRGPLDFYRPPGKLRQYITGTAFQRRMFMSE